MKRWKRGEQMIAVILICAKILGNGRNCFRILTIIFRNTVSIPSPSMLAEEYLLRTAHALEFLLIIMHKKIIYIILQLYTTLSIPR